MLEAKMNDRNHPLGNLGIYSFNGKYLVFSWPLPRMGNIWEEEDRYTKKHKRYALPAVQGEVIWLRNFSWKR